MLPRLLEFVQRLDQSHLADGGLGLSSLVGTPALRRLAAGTAGALVVVAAGIAAVAAFGLSSAASP